MGKARYLIIVKRHQQNEVAKIVGVSTNTIGAWARKYNWYGKENNKHGGLSAIMERFFVHVLKTKPAIAKDVYELWEDFIKKYEAEIEENK